MAGGRRDKRIFHTGRGFEAFADLIDFVRAAERSADAKLDLGQAAALAKSFAASWRAAIAAANADVLRLFANFVNGVEVLKQVFMQLLLYYTRFQEIVRKNGGGDVPFAGDFVPTATILDEIAGHADILTEQLIVRSQSESAPDTAAARAARSTMGRRQPPLGTRFGGEVHANKVGWRVLGGRARKCRRRFHLESDAPRTNDNKPHGHGRDHHRRARRRFWGCDELRLTGRSARPA